MQLQTVLIPAYIPVMLIGSTIFILLNFFFSVEKGEKRKFRLIAVCPVPPFVFATPACTIRNNKM